MEADQRQEVAGNGQGYPEAITGYMLNPLIFPNSSQFIPRWFCLQGTSQAIGMYISSNSVEITGVSISFQEKFVLGIAIFWR